MKIALANSPFGGGGITIYAHELINALSQENEMYVILKDDSKAPIDKKKAKVYYYDCKDHSTSNAKKVIHLINEVIKPDLLIASGATLIPLIAPFLNDAVRLITCSHSARYINSDYCAINSDYIDRIIAASSNYNKEYLEKKFNIKDKEKIKVVLNFVEDIENASAVREEKKKENIIKIVFPGASSPPKTPELALKIANELVKTKLNFKFYWTGSTPIPLSGYFPFLKRKDIRQLIPDDERVVFTGRIPAKKDLDDLVASCNIFLAPSRREGCSMALVEAARDGLILMVADYENSNRIITKHDYNGFVLSRKDAGIFVNQIVDIINAPHKYEKMYDNSRRVYEQELTYTVWKGHIADYVVKCEPRHKKRKVIFSPFLMRCYALKYRWISSIDKWLSFFDENFRVFLFMQRQDIKR